MQIKIKQYDREVIINIKTEDLDIAEVFEDLIISTLLSNGYLQDATDKYFYYKE